MPAQPLSPEQKEDASRLLAAWEAFKKATPGASQEKFAAECGWKTQGSFNQYLHGKIPLNLPALLKMCRVLQIEPSSISPRLAAQLPAKTQESSEDDFADVVHLDVKVSAGHGSVPHFEEELGTLKFRRDFLKSVGVSEANAVVVTASGASMEPTIPDGSALLVNRANREPRANAIYVFHLRGNGLVVKRVVKSGGLWVARSDNDDREAFPDFAFDEGATLIGRAVWVGSKL